VLHKHPPLHQHTPHRHRHRTSCSPRDAASNAAHLQPPRHSRSHDADFCGRRIVVATAAADLYSSHPLRGRVGVRAGSEQILTFGRGGHIGSASLGLS